MSTTLSSPSPDLRGRDRDLQRRVASYLASRHFPAFRELKITAERGIVTVRGRLASFYEKQVAINACRRVAGVTHLVDEIFVTRPR